MALLLCAACERASEGPAPAPPGAPPEAKAPAPVDETKGPPQPPSPKEAQGREQEAALRAELGDVLLKYGRLQDAVAHYAGAIEVIRGVSENAVYHAKLARALRSGGNEEEAAKHFETAAAILQKILERMPADAKEESREFYYEQICLLYREMGRIEDAVAWAERMAGPEKDAASHLKLARLYGLLGQGALAVDSYKAVLKKVGDKPEGLGAKLEYAEFLTRGGDPATARGLAETVASHPQAGPLRVRAKRLLIQIYDALGILDAVDIEAPPTPPGSGGEEEEEKE